MTRKRKTERRSLAGRLAAGKTIRLARAHTHYAVEHAHVEPVVDSSDGGPSGLRVAIQLVEGRGNYGSVRIPWRYVEAALAARPKRKPRKGGR